MALSLKTAFKPTGSQRGIHPRFLPLNQHPRKPAMKHAFAPLRHLTLATLTTLTCASAALAAQPNALAQAQARYRQDIAVCNSGQSYQDPATCRREAASALSEAKRGDLSNNTGTYSKNALQRCAVHKGDDRAACEARILDQGDITKESQAGGILRQSTTVSPSE